MRQSVHISSEYDRSASTVVKYGDDTTTTDIAVNSETTQRIEEGSNNGSCSDFLFRRLRVFMHIAVDDPEES